MRRLALALLGLAAGGCLSDREIAVPSGLGPNARSMLLAMQDRDGLTIRAIDLEASANDRFVLRDGSALTMLVYAERLSQLLIAPGMVPRANEGRSLPRPAAAFRASVEGGAITSWVPTSTLGPELRAFRIATPTDSECLIGGGCYVTASAVAGRVCKIPCAVPEAPAGPAEPALPELPALPSFSCPEGWSERRRDVFEGLVTCEPPEPGPPITCAPGREPFFLDGACSPIGAPCPEGDWPDLGGPVLYVKAGASPGGSGTLARPFGTIAEAIANVRALQMPGQTIALAKGTYGEAVVIPAGTAVLGACVDETVIRPAASTAPAVTVLESGASLMNVAIDASGRGVMVSGDGAALAIDSVSIHTARDYGLLAHDGGRVNGRSVAVHGSSTGISAQAGGRIDLARAVVLGARGLGVHARDQASSIVLGDILVRGTRPTSTSSVDGEGVSALSGGRVEIDRGVIEDNMTFGVYADLGGSISLGDIAVRRTQQNPRAPGSGFGVIAVASKLQLRQVAIDDNAGCGLYLQGSTTATVADVVIRRTRPTDQLTDGYGLIAGTGAHLSASRVLSEGNSSYAVLIGDPHTRTEVQDLVTLDTGRTSGIGIGVAVLNGAELALSRAFLGTGTCMGLTLVRESNQTPKVEASDLTIVKNELGCGGFAGGIQVSFGELTLSRALLSGNGPASFGMNGSGARATIHDLTIADTAPLSDGSAQAIFVTEGRLQLVRTRIQRSALTAISLNGESTFSEIQDLVIEDTRRTSDSDARGLWTAQGVSLNLARARIEKTAGTALDVSRIYSGTPNLARTLIADMTIRDAQGIGFWCRETATASVSRVLIEAVRGHAINAGQECRIRIADAEIRGTTDGSGALFQQATSADITRFRITGGSGPGVEIEHPSLFVRPDYHLQKLQLDLHQGVVSGNDVGLRYPTGSFDISSLLDGVTFERNRLPIEAL